MICKECGIKSPDLYNGLCLHCSLESQVETLDLPIPDHLLFVGKIAKFGKKRRIIEIPKNQRDLINLNQKYYIQLTPVGAKE